ncbi:MAG: adenine phosphoribosyltransferase [Acidothermus sp.]|nr:adenine phosphoribosyltransferase [Acidothermus sp.]MCL6537093.1 adenine phosphoribosyltransferase [Acidothermus sp.]
MTSPAADIAELVARHVRDIPDYPTPGVLFRDITPLLADPTAFAAVVDALVQPWRSGGVDKVVGIEARGFILAAPVAYHLRAGFVPMRKKGKLPYQTLHASYALEYGSATIEVHVDAFRPGDRVLVVDDVLATGGTAAAALDLIRQANADPIGLSFLIELSALGGRARLPEQMMHTLLRL